MGYWPLGVAIASGIGLVTLLIWLAVQHWPTDWAAGLALAAATAVSVIGVTSGGSYPWMVLAATFCLATWDVALLNASLANYSSALQVARLEKVYYPSLGLALGSGLLAALAGRIIQFRLPFVVMLLLVVLAYLLLERLLRALTHAS